MNDAPRPTEKEVTTTYGSALPDKRLRILYVAAAAPAGYTTSDAYFAFPEWLSRHSDLILAHPPDAMGQILAFEKHLAGSLHFTPAIKGLKAFFTEINRIRRQNAFHVVITGVDEVSLLRGIIAASRNGCALVVACEDHPFWSRYHVKTGLRYKLEYLVRVLLLKLLLTRASRIVCFIEQDVLDFLKLPRAKLIQQTNGVSEAILLPPTTDDPGTPAIIGYIGEIHQTKGSIDMLEILKRVRKDMPGVRMLLIGNFASDTERSLFENHATELGLSEAIEVKGYREHSHALQLLRSCTVCIHAYKPLPWLYYNQVLKIGEYMAISKAIVSWDYPGVRRMLNEGGAGILVPPGNLNSMAQNVVRLITDKELRKRLEKSAFDHARKYLVWSRIGEDVFGALKDLLEKDQCPQCHAHRCRPQ